MAKLENTSMERKRDDEKREVEKRGKEERRVGQEKCHPHLKKGRQVLYADEEEPELCFQKSLHRKFYSSWERRSPPGR